MIGSRIYNVGNGQSFFHRCLSGSICPVAAVLIGARADSRGDRIVHEPGVLLLSARGQSIGGACGDPSLVAISVPIDYWDYLGWRDTLANPRNTARQKAYAHVRGDGQVYTPQAVVNGSVHALGSDKAAIEHAIGASSAPLLPVGVAIADGRINLTLPQAPDGPAEAWLCGLNKAATIAIGRGENKGRTITYRNVVRRWVKLGDWAGRARSWSVPLQTLAGDGIDEAAVLLQIGTSDKPRGILGAATAALR